MDRRTNHSSAIFSLNILRWPAFYQMLIFTILLGTAFDNMDQATCSFILPMMRMEWHLTFVESSYMPVAALLGTCIGAIFWGMIADRVGRRRAFVWTIMLFSITNLIQTHAWSYLQFTLTCFFMGIGVGGEIPLAFTFLSEFLPKLIRTRAEILMGVLAIVIGYAFSAMSAHFLLPLAGWKSLFYVQALPAILVLVIRFRFPESPRYLQSTGQAERATSTIEMIGKQCGNPALVDELRHSLTSDERRFSWLEGLRALWQPMYWQRSASSWIFGFCVGFFEFGFLIWLPTTLQSQGYRDAQSVNYPMLINFFAIPSAFFALYLLNKGGSKLLLSVYPLIAGVLTLLFGLFLPEIAASPIILVLVGGGIFFFGITLLGIFPPYSSEIYPTAIRGTGSGWATGISRVGSFLGPMVGGLFLNWGIPPQVELVLFGLCLLLGFLVMVCYGVQTNMLDLETISPHVEEQQPEQVEFTR